MDSSRIRSSFLRFFEERGHEVRPSASLIPVDPTLLLTNAGMVPFKPYFLGEETPPYPRAASVQKVFRSVDIDIIGTTARHFTFFQMLGNFSFGDYFKEKAIPYAYDLITEGFGIDPELLWFTVHETDDEAEAIWIDGVGAHPDRVQRRGKDNFWQMGVPGPAGPSSEIFYDRGAAYGPDGGPAVDEERFVEIWNLVFMQYVQDKPYHVVGDLPARSIDTGLGLERMAMVLQGKETVFDIDIVRPVLAVAERHSGVTYGKSPLTDVSLRVLADHGRAMTFLIADGVVPSNEGRGYVLRRVLRRAVRHAWRLGGEGLITPLLVDKTVQILGSGYPELVNKQSFIQDVVSREEDRFRATLSSGHNLLDEALSDLGEGDRLDGSVAFKLHDTFGFPVELTTEIASEQGVDVDLDAFETAMHQQRERARSAWKGAEEAADAGVYRTLLEGVGPSEFLGYSELAVGSSIVAMLRGGESIKVAGEGQVVEVFLDRTPFYAEAGGQVGDSGLLQSTGGARGVVTDTQAAVPGLVSHHVSVVSGELSVGDQVEAMVDSPRREAISKSHTGTHILHWALRHVLGEHVHQAGSRVEAGRLRFDFSHFGGLASEECDEVERIANERVIANAHVHSFNTSMDQARDLGALAFFGDKYGDVVRVVEIGDFSKELCGGTHTPSAGQVGPLVILGESSVGSNLRRIEAYSGDQGYEYLSDLRKHLGETGEMLRAKPEEVPSRVRQLLDRTRALEEEASALRSKLEAEEAGELVDEAEVVGSSKLVVATKDVSPGELRGMALTLRDRLGRGVVVLGSAIGGKGALVAVVSPDLVAKGVSAADLLVPGARILGGGGSRDPELAQAGGPNGGRLGEALDAIRDAAGRALA